VFEAIGPLPACPWWPRPLGWVSVVLVVLVEPVMGFFEVFVVTLASCRAGRARSRSMMPGLRAVVCAVRGMLMCVCLWEGSFGFS